MSKTPDQIEKIRGIAGEIYKNISSIGMILQTMISHMTKIDNHQNEIDKNIKELKEIGITEKVLNKNLLDKKEDKEWRA